MTPWRLVHCDGRAASAGDLATPALLNDGHFTTLQVRDGAVQGLDLHVERLRDASRQLFGTDEAPARIFAAMRAALDALGQADATLRITIFPEAASSPADAPTRILVAAGLPWAPETQPLRLRGYRYMRHLPEIKHVGTFPLFNHRRLARAEGFDDALFVDDGGRVCEGSVWNLALWDGVRVLWPRASALRGTRERLLQAAFAAMGVPQAEAVVPLERLPSLAGLACNARGVQPLAAIDGRPMQDPGPLQALAAEADTRTPWTPIPGAEEVSPTVGATGPL